MAAITVGLHHMERQDLERRYIQLLETRVFELQTQLSLAGIAPPKPETPPVVIEQPPPQALPKPEDDKKPTTEKKPDPDPEAENPRYRVVINTLDPESGEYKDKPAAAVNKAAETKPNRAFTFRKHLEKKNDVLKQKWSQFEIVSEPLQRLLEQVMEKYTETTRITTLDAPYRSLVYSWDTAEREANAVSESDSAEKKQAREDLKEMLKLISASSGSEMLDRYFKNKQNLEDSSTITIDTLWTLFPRGSIVVAKPFLKMNQAFLVQSTYCAAENPDDTHAHDKNFYLLAFGYDWDGGQFNRVPFVFKIDYFSNRKSISDLPITPLDRYQNPNETPEELRTRLIKRGKKYREYAIKERGKQTFQYDGKVYHEKDSGLFDYGKKSQTPWWWEDSGLFNGKGNESTTSVTSYIKGPVIVDFKSYLDYRKQNAPVLGLLQFGDWEPRQETDKIYHYSWDRKTKDDELSDEQYLLMPPRVLGYSLGKKRWVQLAVENLSPPEPADRTTFDKKLQLSTPHKELIRKAVEAHDKTNIIDFVQNKGRGLVVLLWGIPGVGKTLTAESVAMLAGKPLFTVGVSDIGLEGERVETNLQRIFDLAGLWKAVLLFDEADVFLEARDTHATSIGQNTIVSVLLRVLEYYEGILMLTTNRLKSLDIAVQSRIHIAVQFKDLTSEQRRKIFLEFLGQLRENELVGDWARIVQWVEDEGQEKELNGRQIRNLVSTAMSIAHAEGRPLRDKDLADVTKNTMAFKNTLAEQDLLYRNKQIKAAQY